MFKFIFLIFMSILSLQNTIAFAAITVVSGNNQTIAVGSPSKDLTFKVVDAVGHPVTGVAVHFTLVGPSGNTINGGLSKATDNTNEQGQVVTQMNPIDTLGNYSLTATLAIDATQSVTATLTVTADRAATLQLISGGGQNIGIDQASAEIRFQLTDKLGHPIAGEKVDFTVITPNGITTTSGLMTATAMTNTQGEVNTRIAATAVTGIYTLIARLSSNSAITSSTHLQVALPAPNLPSLGFGGIVGASGSISDNLALFNGGIAIYEIGTPPSDDDFQQELVQKSSDVVVIRGVIRPENTHLGQVADIVVAAGHEYRSSSPPFALEKVFYTLDKGIPQLWDGGLSSLAAFASNVTLSSSQPLDIYNGQLPVGTFQIWFGYYLKTGLVVFNANQSINVIVKP